MYKNKGGKKRRGRFRISALLAAAAMAVCLSGCDIKIPDVLTKVTDKIGAGSGKSIFRIGGEKCSVKEAEIILLNYQKQYEDVYGLSLWDRDVEEGRNLEDYVKTLTISQLAQVYMLDAIAQEMEMELSQEEQDLAKQAAEAYFDGLSEEEISYLSAGKDDAEALFGRYALAQKLYDQMTENVDVEVSDDEARVMRVKQIYTADEDKARELLQQIDGGSDFATVAAANTEASAVDVNIDRSMFPEDMTEALFDLEDGETSAVLQGEEGYYIFYCVKAYDADLTEENKTNVLEQRLSESMEEVYAAHMEELESSLREDNWSGIRVDTGLHPEGSSFLEVYEKYFG